MSDEQVVSNPARDLLHGLEVVENNVGDTFVQKFALATKTQPWSKDFYHGLKLIHEVIDCIKADLLHNQNLDEEDRAYLETDIERIRSILIVENVVGQWSGVIRPNAPFGPESRTFLRTASRQLKAAHGYKTLTQKDNDLIYQCIENIRADMREVVLEKADFAREALLRGCEEVSFILARIDVFGFSRIERPIMNLGSFLHTVAEEVRRQEGSDKKVKRSLSSLSHVFRRLKDLATFVNAGQVGYDGVTWLLENVE